MSSLDKWREYFRGANSDIFDIIEYALMVAASDCPYEFKLKRDRIAEMLFSCKVTKCFGCERVELAVPNSDSIEKSNNDDDDKYKSGILDGGSKDTKESNANMNVNQVSNCSYGDAAEALTDEIEEESQSFDEVMRIKEIVDNSEEESDDLLYESLTRLQLMHLSVETLKATEIGKSVNALRKHGLMDIRNLARILIEDWKVMVDAWVNATAAIAGAEVETESVKTSVNEEEEEEGLPSPPMDVGAFFTTPTSMELSQFFDEMDDDGNPRNGGEFNKNRDNGRKLNLAKANIPKRNHESPRDFLSAAPKERNGEQKRNHEPTLKQAPPCKPNRHSGGETRAGRPKPPVCESGPGRPKPALQPKTNNDIKVQQKLDKGTVQRKPAPHQEEKLNCNNEASVRMKLEAAKRKLQERYKEAQNAKKQRMIQVVELQDLPKQSFVQRNQNMRPGSNNRHRAKGRL